jgi:hypothetical protein
MRQSLIFLLDQSFLCHDSFIELNLIEIFIRKRGLVLVMFKSLVFNYRFDHFSGVSFVTFELKFDLRILE